MVLHGGLLRKTARMRNRLPAVRCGRHAKALHVKKPLRLQSPPQRRNFKQVRLRARMQQDPAGLHVGAKQLH